MQTHEEPRWTALVAEDDSDIRQTVREILELEGFRVIEAAHGRAAERGLREAGSIDLIVTDILMPDEDGLELIIAARHAAAASAKKPKILAISGGGTFSGPDLYLSNADRLGADLSLAKPFSDLDLVAALRRLGFNPAG